MITHHASPLAGRATLVPEFGRATSAGTPALSVHLILSADCACRFLSSYQQSIFFIRF